MARALSKTERGFNVTAEVNIGWVRLTGDGEHSPMEVAFLMIAQHHQSSDLRDTTYRVPGPDEGQVIEIDVTCHEGRDTERYFN